MSTTKLLSPLFFFNDTATTEIYTLSLHDALPISFRDQTGNPVSQARGARSREPRQFTTQNGIAEQSDRKSTRLNSSHLVISYAVFCLKKKMKSYISDKPNSHTWLRTQNTLLDICQ